MNHESGKPLPGNRSKTAAISEVVGVFIGAFLIARALSSLLGLTTSKEQINALSGSVSPDFYRMAWITALDLLLKYGIMLGLALLIGWWHRRRRPEAYGLTLAGRSVWLHMGNGMLLYAVIGLIPALLLLLQNYITLGAGPDHWTIFSYEWNFGFWVFMAVSSFGLVPVLEELFTRGYFQTRLTEDLGAASAILITSCMFAFSHTQYLRLSAMSLGTLFGILLGSIIGGWYFYRTRSLLPVIVAHALGNIPSRGAVEAILPIVMLLIIILFWKSYAGKMSDLFRDMRSIESMSATLWGLLAVAGIVITLVLQPLLLIIWGSVGLALALYLEFKDVRKYPENSTIY